MSTPTWHVFCRVIDNFGDAGVALRFCRNLSLKQSHPITLFIDDTALLRSLMDEEDQKSFQVASWQQQETLADASSHVITLFGCRLSNHYHRLMEKRTPLPQWVNVEHLSAEKWIESFHLLPSPHPPLVEYFYYPGFTQNTGGLLYEPWLKEWAQTKNQQLTSHASSSFKICLFCYPSAPVESLIDVLEDSAQHCHLYIPEDLILPPALLDRLHSRKSNHYKITWLPRLAQKDWDLLLKQCDLLFVRGEESWARAQLLGVPCIWHIYPQAHDAHWAKLAAFLEDYLAHSNERLKETVQSLYEKWNRGLPLSTDLWLSLLEESHHFKQLALQRQNTLLQQPDLITQLLVFLQNTPTMKQ